MTNKINIGNKQTEIYTEAIRPIVEEQTEQINGDIEMETPKNPKQVKHNSSDLLKTTHNVKIKNTTKHIFTNTTTEHQEESSSESDSELDKLFPKHKFNEETFRRDILNELMMLQKKNSSHSDRKINQCFPKHKFNEYIFWRDVINEVVTLRNKK